MKNSRDIKDCIVELQKAWQLARDVYKQKYPSAPQPFLTQTYRPYALQEAYYAQGRMALIKVNELRKKVGIAPITANENRIKVTNAKPGQSLHNVYPSRAFDIAFTDVKGDEWNGNYPVKFFKLFADIIKPMGVRWGGDFNGKFKDLPHFEMPLGYFHPM